MSEVKKIRTACRQCHGGCGVIAHVRGGKVIKVEGDPDSPISNGTLCSKGLSATQLTYHPDRILHPMRKTAQGGWERITWDEARIRLPKNLMRLSMRMVRNPLSLARVPGGTMRAIFTGLPISWERRMC